MKTFMKKTILLATLLLTATVLHAKLALRHPTGDHMVLQQNAEAAVWGYASPGATITVTPTWDGKAYLAKADARGHWTAYLKTPQAGYDVYSISVKGDGDKIVISDVLVGEVWLASGQSNMEIPIKGFDNCPIEGYGEIVTRRPRGTGSGCSMPMPTRPTSRSKRCAIRKDGGERTRIPSPT